MKLTLKTDFSTKYKIKYVSADMINFIERLK